MDLESVFVGFKPGTWHFPALGLHFITLFSCLLGPQVYNKMGKENQTGKPIVGFGLFWGLILCEEKAGGYSNLSSATGRCHHCWVSWGKSPFLFGLHWEMNNLLFSAYVSLKVLLILKTSWCSSFRFFALWNPLLGSWGEKTTNTCSYSMSCPGFDWVRINFLRSRRADLLILMKGLLIPIYKKWLTKAIIRSIGALPPAKCCSHIWGKLSDVSTCQIYSSLGLTASLVLSSSTQLSRDVRKPGYCCLLL